MRVEYANTQDRPRKIDLGDRRTVADKRLHRKADRTDKKRPWQNLHGNENDAMCFKRLIRHNSHIFLV